MRRLLASLKKSRIPFPPQDREKLKRLVSTLDLQPGQEIPQNIIDSEFIFLESGFLVSNRLVEGKWEVVNLYYEGSSLIILYEENSPLFQGEYKIVATEPSTIEYLTEADFEILNSFCPNIQHGIYALKSFTLLLQLEMKNVLRVTPKDRSFFIAHKFPELLRAPTASLAEICHLTSKKDKMTLIAEQTKKFPQPRPQS